MKIYPMTKWILGPHKILPVLGCYSRQRLKAILFELFYCFVDFILCMASDYDVFLNLIYIILNNLPSLKILCMFAYVSKVHIILCHNVLQSLSCPNFSNLVATVLISFSPSQIFLSRQLQPNWPLSFCKYHHSQDLSL